MSVFHQIKNIFRHHVEEPRINNKSDQYEAAATKIVQEESKAKSKLPEYEGLTEKFNLTNKLGEYVKFTHFKLTQRGPTSKNFFFVNSHIFNRGAFSNVYKAVDKTTGQSVAIKIVRKFELSQIQVKKV